MCQNIWKAWNSQLEGFHFWNCLLYKAISHIWEGGGRGSKGEEMHLPVKKIYIYLYINKRSFPLIRAGEGSRVGQPQ